jgi:hypothetical protein
LVREETKDNPGELLGACTQVSILEDNQKLSFFTNDNKLVTSDTLQNSF